MSDRQNLQEGKQRLQQLLREHSVRTDRTFTLASGRVSDFYVDVKKTSLHPEGAYWIGRLFVDVLSQYPEVRAVGGPTLGADPLTTATSVLAWTLGRALDAFIVRKEPKDHGTAQWLEGPDLVPDTPVVLLEDVITSGGSARTAIERVREAGLKVEAVLAVVDRDEGGREHLQAAGVPLHALFLRRDFQSGASE